MNPKIEMVKEEVLSNNWYLLKKMTFKYQKRDGSWETQAREAYDRGNGAVILLYNRKQQTVILTQQFRMPTYMNGNETGMLIEACAGLLDKDSPEDCIRRETEEETGYRITNVHKVWEAYMSPGSVTEILYFFVAEYSPHMQTGRGGGVEKEQEEIEVLELPIEQALNMVKNGEIRDAKTIMLLQYAQLNGLVQPESKPQHILIAGPYRSNTGDDKELIGANMRLMNETALRVYEMGHMPVLGEWYALPLMETAGSRELGDEIFERMFHPSAVRLLSLCDAVLRVGGPSEGANEMVRNAEVKGKKVYRDLGEIPVLA
ncbi:GDP-mannose pyrophosphatase NudK [Paenibacillus macquariensis]|uniref:Nudix-type nucleoside diphosphatase, YffH/AdpP family n=1 Tax=Paenibacillus macquariensis TaxID=948756 RepID=A0ABY1JPW6_9BACL|nr:GDP-mannose pyrophosphatase NudK [Paenibacillus macquariensis]MEC0094059.1 GDP-mannose pyrophosphatase NudK [Paenibacillus macquariensis]OAB37522.1 ADP-ribose pyrophosphatase [Paenibacillus macquariensis subsp. macquariensis]SIQ55458.1 nudix-type nucleoside diphosphatase, YffH/AdpP family [Paenibacillus macquariensis]